MYVIIPVMKQLEADLKNGIYKNIYLLHGPQSYLRKRYVKAISDHFVSEGDTLNLSFFYGNKTDMEEVSSMAATMPFLSEKRVIVLEDTGFFTHASDDLAGLIETLPDTTILIFSEEKISRDLKQTKSAVSKGCVAVFDKLTDQDLRKWVLGRLGREHRPITRPALDLFLSRCTDDMWQISNDLEKLISYTFGSEGIRVEDVEAVCAPLAEDKIFQMIDAILDADVRKAMGFYRDLLILGRDPLSLIREQLRLMLHLKEMGNAANNAKEAAKMLGMKEGRVKMALSASRKRSKIYFAKGIEKCAGLEEDIKTSRIDATIGVEALIIDLCRQS